jgi:hypothetical protein
VRNRVAMTDVRGSRRWLARLVRASVFLTAAAVALLGAAQPASAETAAETAADQMAFGALGPVGIAAVVVGFGGLVVGLLRRRRRTLAARPVTEARPVVAPVDADRAA